MQGVFVLALVFTFIAMFAIWGWPTLFIMAGVLVMMIAWVSM